MSGVRKSVEKMPSCCERFSQLLVFADHRSMLLLTEAQKQQSRHDSKAFVHDLITLKQLVYSIISTFISVFIYI